MPCAMCINGEQKEGGEVVTPLEPAARNNADDAEKDRARERSKVDSRQYKNDCDCERLEGCPCVSEAFRPSRKRG